MNGSKTPQPSKPGIGRMFNTNAITCNKARYEIAPASAAGGENSVTINASSTPITRFVTGPASETNDSIFFDRSDSAEREQHQWQHDAQHRVGVTADVEGQITLVTYGEIAAFVRDGGVPELVQAQRHRPPGEYEEDGARDDGDVAFEQGECPSGDGCREQAEEQWTGAHR
jgi:hypothetical protein